MKTAALAVALILVEQVCVAQTGTGSMELYCDMHTYLNLRIDSSSGNSRLFLHLWASPLDKEDPAVLDAKWCSPSSPDLVNAKKGAIPLVCEPVKAIVKFTKVNLDKKASGSYSIQFEDGTKKEDSFTVTRDPRNRHFLCE